MNTEALLLTTRSARPPFLILTLSCISLGVAIALSTPGVDVHLVDVFLILLAGIASHISVNAFNEYFDFRSGLDELTERTPFSGGSGLLPTHPD
ncbi:prenyltransferase, partial [Solemya velum gill symbiont]